jgi:hypothetical protein
MLTTLKLLIKIILKLNHRYIMAKLTQMASHMVLVESIFEVPFMKECLKMVKKMALVV